MKHSLKQVIQLELNDRDLLFERCRIQALQHLGTRKVGEIARACPGTSRLQRFILILAEAEHHYPVARLAGHSMARTRQDGIDPVSGERNSTLDSCLYRTGQIYVRHGGVLRALHRANHVPVYFHRYRAMQQLYRDHHPQGILFANQDAFQTRQ
jgi:hypothetical protein